MQLFMTTFVRRSSPATLHDIIDQSISGELPVLGSNQKIPSIERGGRKDYLALAMPAILVSSPIANAIN